MPFISALNLVQKDKIPQKDNLSAVQAVTGLINDDLYANFTSGQVSLTDTVDRLDLYETTTTVDLTALQVPRRTIKFGA